MSGSTMRLAAVWLCALFALPACNDDAPELVAIEVTPLSPTIEIGDTQAFKAEAVRSDDSREDMTSIVTWRSTDPNLVVITGAGVASGLASGGVTISASFRQIVGSTSLTVAPPRPTLSGISPSYGPQAGGTTVALSGTHLADATAVTFGDVPAALFTAESASRIVAVAPPGVGGVTVTVTTPAGTSNGLSFGYAAPPTLTDMTPPSGPQVGGTSVTLTGTAFTTASVVRFGDVRAAAITVVSATSITATSPAGTGVVEVTVATENGTSGGYAFEYLAD